MKRFLKNILIFLLAVVILTVSLNVACIERGRRNNHGTMGEIRNNNDYIRDVPNGIQVCDFGSSHGFYGFRYRAFPDVVSFNFALVSQYPSYDYRVLQQFGDKLAENAAVFIELSYFSFFGPDETEEENFSAKNRRYYLFLSDELIKEYDVKTDLYMNYFPALLTSGPINLVQTLLDTNSTDTWDYETNPEAAAVHGPARSKSHILLRLDENGRRIINQVEIDALLDLAALCRELGARPIFITTPYLSEYPDAIEKDDPTFFDDFYSVIDEICSKTGAPYYDYSRDERFSGAYSLFFDSDHLNRKGAEKFTSVLLEEVLGLQSTAEENFP